MKRFVFETEQWFPKSVEEIFPFFADARNLERITPSWLKFEVVTNGETEIEEGALIDYKLTLRGVPLKWRTLISRWNPPHHFVDEQIKGPYRLWVHTHRFEAQDGGTLASDHVVYATWGGSLANKLLIEPDLKKIFAFRHRALAQIFGESDNEAKS